MSWIIRLLNKKQKEKKKKNHKEKHPLVLTFEGGSGGSCAATLGPKDRKGLIWLSKPADIDLFLKKRCETELKAFPTITVKVTTVNMEIVIQYI